MKRKGFIQGCEVSFENSYPMHHELYLETDREGVVKCLKSLPAEVDYNTFLIGMMRLTQGRLNPQMILEVWNETR